MLTTSNALLIFRDLVFGYLEFVRVLIAQRFTDCPETKINKRVLDSNILTKCLTLPFYDPNFTVVDQCPTFR